MSLLPDIALIGQVLIFGNRRAFDSLVRKYQGPVRRLLLTLTAGDETLSDDLAQETFVKAYTSLESYKNHSNFATWLYRIAYNVFYDYIRTRKETSGFEDWEVDASYSTEPNNVGATMDIYRGLSTLKEKESACLGTAILAGVGCGVWKSVEEACKKLVATKKTYVPGATDYSAPYRQFKNLEALLNNPEVVICQK